VEAAKQKIQKSLGVRHARHSHSRGDSEYANNDSRAPLQMLVAMRAHDDNTSKPSPLGGTPPGCVNAPQAKIVPASFRRDDGRKRSRTTTRRYPARVNGGLSGMANKV
jgi:hypothetical protein